jgi:hypothetical protein
MSHRSNGTRNSLPGYLSILHRHTESSCFSAVPPHYHSIIHPCFSAFAYCPLLACGLVPQHPVASYGTLITLDDLPQNEYFEHSHSLNFVENSRLQHRELLQTHGQHQVLCQQAELDSPESLTVLGQCIGLAPYWWKPYAIATSRCIDQGCVEVALEYAVAGLLRATCKTRLAQLAKFVLLKLQSPLNQLLLYVQPHTHACVCTACCVVRCVALCSNRLL